jgi:CHASE2 domain-containing sensor protein/signal transduction histidine kinase
MFNRARTRSQQRRAEWAAIGLTLLALVTWLSAPGVLPRTNHLVQDSGLRLLSRPPQPDIVVIAIEERSIAAIGRWPWRRALHAQLIQNMSRQEPLAIGMDVLFNEEDLDYPEDDLLLADAVAKSGRVVLPVMQRQGPSDAGGDGSDLPMAALEHAAARLGHVHVAPDTDGVVRSLYLREGPADAPWPHFSTAMRCVATPSLAGCTPARLPSAEDDDVPWERTDRTLIPFAGGPGHFTTYSYIDVLRGEIPADALRGKYVLVGSVAAGLGDMFATPVGRESRLMPGVEVVAQVLDADLSGVRIDTAPRALNTAFNLLPVALALLALLLLGPFAALLTSVALAALTLVLAVVLPVWSGLQFAPAAALTGLVLAYPLWSWRRLSAAAQFLRVQMENLQRQGLVIPLRGPAASSGDFLEKRINAVEYASRQLRDMHHFVSESLQQLPSPTMVCDTEGHILLANMAARHHLLGLAEASGDPMVWPLQGRQITDVLGDLIDTVTDQPLVTPERLVERTLPARREGRDAKGRSVLVQSRQFTDLAQAGWLVTLVDLTEMRSALQQRDQAMHFISHDIRAPNASILTLLEMHRAYPGRMSDEELMQRIARYAQASLGMAENFVQLVGAESQAMRREALDLSDVLHETADEAWALAREGDVEVVVTEAPDTAAFTGDRALLCRALANVINNAIKYSPRGGRVHCALQARPGFWVVSVRDEGPGIAPALQDKLFAPFQRLHDRSHPGIAGVGLGLALVHTVVQRHGGSIEVESDEGRGAEFRLVLPQGKAPTP